MIVRILVAGALAVGVGILGVGVYWHRHCDLWFDDENPG